MPAGPAPCFVQLSAALLSVHCIPGRASGSMGLSLLGQPGIVFVGYCWMSVNPTAVTHEATNCHVSLEYYSVELSFLSAVFPCK